MTRGFVNTGPKAGQVGLPQGKRWRCPACTLLVKFEKLKCPRCTESVTEEERDEYYVNPNSVTKQHVPFHLSRPTGQGENTKPTAKQLNNVVIKESKKPTRTTKTNNTLKSKNINHTKNTRSSNNASKKGKSTTSVRGFNANKKTCNKKISRGNSKMKRVAPPPHKMDPKKLGYKASNKGNANSFGHSKLHNDTAAYRGKFTHTAKKLKGSKMNIATIENLVSKNGFNTTINYMKKSSNGTLRHSERAVTPPPQRKGSKKKKSGPSWITQLQAAASTGAVASLKHTGTCHKASHMDIGGKKSKYAM